MSDTRPVSIKMLMKTMDHIGDVMVQALKVHRDHIKKLEQRIAAIEKKPHVKFCGVWKAGQMYGPGDAATHHGGLWVCKVETTGEPSKDFAAWQLAVKKGDAR